MQELSTADVIPQGLSTQRPASILHIALQHSPVPFTDGLKTPLGVGTCFTFPNPLRIARLLQRGTTSQAEPASPLQLLHHY